MQKALPINAGRLRLKYFERFQDINQAIHWEKQIKGWSRKKKEALFNDDWGRIKELAKSKGRISSK